MKPLQLRLGIESLLGLRRRGIFVAPDQIATVNRREFDRYTALERLFDDKQAAFAAFLGEIDVHADALETFVGASPPEPRFEQDWFPRLDAAAYYTIVRRNRPRRIVEIGSGHSTRFACRAVADEGFCCDITAIDPQPRADLEQLPVTQIRQPVQDVPLAVFEQLRAGDIFIVDSGHVLMPGTDVDFAINRVLPLLPPGTLVSFHDIFLPDAYPDAWPFGLYNEQNGVAVLLQGGYEIVFASAYVTSRMKAALEDTVIARLPLPDTAVENGFWLRKL